MSTACDRIDAIINAQQYLLELVMANQLITQNQHSPYAIIQLRDKVLERVHNRSTLAFGNMTEAAHFQSQNKVMADHISRFFERVSDVVEGS